MDAKDIHVELPEDDDEDTVPDLEPTEEAQQEAHQQIAEALFKEHSEQLKIMEAQQDEEKKRQAELLLKQRQQRAARKAERKRSTESDGSENAVVAVDMESSGKAEDETNQRGSSSHTVKEEEREEEGEGPNTPEIAKSELLGNAPTSLHAFLGLESLDAMDASTEASEYTSAFREAIRQVLTYAEEETPRDDPFRFKYRARAILLEMKCVLLAMVGVSVEQNEAAQVDVSTVEPVEGLSDEEETQVRDAVSAVDIYLGCNFIDCEENHMGQSLLHRAYANLGRVQVDSLYTLPGVDEGQEEAYFPLWQRLFNQLGLLWCMREEFTKSYQMLRVSERLYAKHMLGSETIEDGFVQDALEGDALEQLRVKEAQLRSTKLWFHLVGDLDSFSVGQSSTSSEEAVQLSANPQLNVKNKHSIEAMYTLAQFYLAQVLTHLHKSRLAATYCHLTLKRQLEEGNYDRLDWGTNAMQISSLYLEQRNWLLAEHCLRAADKVLPDVAIIGYEDITTENEYEVRARANMEQAWADFHSTRLSDAAEVMDAKRLEQIGEEVPDLSWLTPVSNTQAELDKLLFHTLEIEHPLYNGELLPTDFASARSVYLEALSHYENAKVYYVIDGFVTDHVRILMDCARLTMYLVSFEDDPERVVKMHKMRLKPVLPLIDELNPNYYLDQVRSMQFMAAEGYYKIHETKRQMREMEMTHVKGLGNNKLNETAKEAIKYYQAFVDTMRDTSTGKFPEKGLLEEFERPYLMARFCMARLKSTLFTESPQMLLINTKAALDEYTLIVEYVKAHPRAQESFGQEMPIVLEMIKLLPNKLNQLARAISQGQTDVEVDGQS